MKGLGPGMRRLLWWGALAIFVFCGSWIAYYLYTAAATTRAIGAMAGEIFALRNSSVPSNTPAAPKSSQANKNPAATLPDVPAKTENNQKRETISEDASTPAPLFLAGASPDVQYTAPPQTAPETEEADALLAYYQSLAEKNPDFIGWIAIENTAVDYPVMYTPEDPQKYLHRDFEGRYSFAGLPFLDASCDLSGPAANLIVYAHNMRSGQMFAEVTKYLDPDFLKAHPVVLFDTLSERREFEVIAVLQIDLKPLSDPSMLCYSTSDTATQAAADELNEYISRFASIRVGKVQAGDSILTLSTCKRIGNLDRMVVIGRSPGKE